MMRHLAHRGSDAREPPPALRQGLPDVDLHTTAFWLTVPAALVERLIASANRRGGTDNITVIVVRITA